MENLGFEQTATGFRATDDQVAWWQARDTCPSCSEVVSPESTALGIHYYAHHCNGPVTWTGAAWTGAA